MMELLRLGLGIQVHVLVGHVIVVIHFFGQPMVLGFLVLERWWLFVAFVMRMWFLGNVHFLDDGFGQRMDVGVMLDGNMDANSRWNG